MSLGLPPAASALAPRVDALFYTVTAVTTFVALAVFATMIVFAIRYRAGAPRRAPRGRPATQARARRLVEIAWILIPLALFCTAFAWAGRLYVARAVAAPNAVRVYVVARQWMWKLQHADGQREIDELHVPRGQPVRLIMTSQDVIHSFFVPAFRLKQDVLPGRYTELSFTPTVTGRFHLFCAEFCGTDHAQMGGGIVVLEPAEFARWLARNPEAQGMAAQGAALFRGLGCSGCHGANAAVHAPDLAGIYGKPVPLADGSTTVADDQYVRDSILTPAKQVAAGYAPIMPSFAGQVSEDDIAALIAYIRSLNAGDTPR